MEPITLTDWHLDTHDGPGADIIVRIVGTAPDRQRIVSAPIVSRLPKRLVLTEGGFYRLGH